MENIDIKCAVPPRISVASAGSKKSLLAAAAGADLIVTTKMLGQKLPSYATTIDTALNGAIARELVGFEGQAGSQRLLDLQAQGISFGAVRYVLCLGLGDYRNFHSSRVCGLMEVVMSKASLLECDSIALVIPPNRLTDEGPSMMGTAAIIRCRAAVFAETPHRHVPLELKLICSPQAKPHLLAGLAVAPPRCRVCVLPTL